MHYWGAELTRSSAPVSPNGSGPREFAAAVIAARTNDESNKYWLSSYKIPEGRGKRREGHNNSTVPEQEFKTGRDAGLKLLKLTLAQGLDLNTEWDEVDITGETKAEFPRGWTLAPAPWSAWNTPWHMAVLGCYTPYPEMRTSGCYNDEPQLEIFLIGHGIDVNCYNARGRNVIHEMIELQRPEPNEEFYNRIRFLIRQGVDVNAFIHESTATSRHTSWDKPVYSHGLSALSQAIQLGDPTLMDVLIDEGAGVSLSSRSAWLPLEIAILSRKSASLACLLKRGARLNEMPLPQLQKESHEDAGVLKLVRRLIGSTRALPSLETKTLFNRILSSKRFQEAFGASKDDLQSKSQHIISAYISQLSQICEASYPNPSMTSRCPQCTVFELAKEDIKWENIADLERSAKSGCLICELIFDALGKSQLQDEKLGGKVRIRVGRDSPRINHIFVERLSSFGFDNLPRRYRDHPRLEISMANIPGKEK
jgi:hypothetical protein